MNGAGIWYKICYLLSQNSFKASNFITKIAVSIVTVILTLPHWRCSSVLYISLISPVFANFSIVHHWDTELLRILSIDWVWSVYRVVWDLESDLMKQVLDSMCKAVFQESIFSLVVETTWAVFSRFYLWWHVHGGCDLNNLVKSLAILQANECVLVVYALPLVVFAVLRQLVWLIEIMCLHPRKYLSFHLTTLVRTILCLDVVFRVVLFGYQHCNV